MVPTGAFANRARRSNAQSQAFASKTNAKSEGGKINVLARREKADN